MNTKKLFIISIILGIVVVGYYKMKRYQAEHPQPVKMVATKDTYMFDELPIEISSIQLYMMYEKNEVAADAKYKGHLLNVTGTVLEIKKDAFDHPFIILRGPGEYDHVMAKFENEKLLMNVSPGDHMELVGECDGMILGCPILKGCVIP